MIVVRGLAWLVLATMVGVLAGMVGWVIARDEFALPDRPMVADTGAPRAAGATSPDAVAVVLTPIGMGSDGVIVPTGGSADVVIEIRNPEFTRYDQVEVAVDLLDGRCVWPDGSPESIWFLDGRSSIESVCQWELTGEDLGSLTVVVTNAGREIGRARLVGTVATPTAPTMTEVDAPGVPLGGEILPETSDETPGSPCPALFDWVEPNRAFELDGLGPVVGERARLLDLDTCPEWAGAATIDLVPAEAGGVCTGWLVLRDDEAVGELRVDDSQLCDLASQPIYLDMDAEVGDLAPQVTILVSWALSGERHTALAVAATLDRTAKGSCDDGQLVRARAPYLQDLPDGSTIYRTVLEAC